MFNIAHNGIITVNRGDSFTFPIFLNSGTNIQPVKYDLDDSCYVYFAVMEPNQPFENALIKKKYTINDVDENGNVIIKFRPQDTQCVLPGKYYYQVKVQKFNSLNSEDYDVNTIVGKTLFYVIE